MNVWVCNAHRMVQYEYMYRHTPPPLSALHGGESDSDLVCCCQFIMAVVVLSAILPPESRHIRWLVSAGLAQVSEFSLVLGSRARRAGIISREVSDLSSASLSLLPESCRCWIQGCCNTLSPRFGSDGLAYQCFSATKISVHWKKRGLLNAWLTFLMREVLFDWKKDWIGRY